MGISIDDPKTAEDTVRVLGLHYPILPDSNRQLMRLFGVLHPEEALARPATFLIDRDGYVRYRYIGKDYSDRPAAPQLLGVLQWL